jgi:hypothetical protein
MSSFHGVGLLPNKEAVDGNANFLIPALVAASNNRTVISILSRVVSTGCLIELGMLVTNAKWTM